MFPEGQEKALQEWQELEAEMKEKYMNDMRHLEIIEEAEAQEEGYREFLVKLTGAKITLLDALQHLYHFCNTLPATPYTVLAPIFTFEHMVSTKVSCKVILPNTVHSSVREFRSTDTWFTEKWARMDAAFEAYVGLYHAGLVNGNLLPSPNYDKDVAKAYAEVAKRPAVANINAKYDPWPAVAAAWQSTLTLYPSIIRILSGAREILRMKMIAPCQLPQLSDLTLYVDSKTVLHVKIDSEIGRTRKEINVTTANKITDVLLTSVFPSKMERDDGGFPLLFTPAEDVDDLENWLEHVQ
ncbi:MAG: Dicer-like protein 2, partial [Candelina submexicana]